MTQHVELPVLTADDISAAKRGFIATVRRELLIEGEDGPFVDAVLAEMPDRIRVRSKVAGAEVRYIGEGGGPGDLASATREVLTAARKAAQLAAFGPNPSALLVERLQKLGVPAHEATRYTSRVERQPDGRVALWTPDGGYVAFTTAPVDGQTYTPDQLATIYDPKPALARATRAIITERERAAGIETARAGSGHMDARGAF